MINKLTEDNSIQSYTSVSVGWLGWSAGMVLYSYRAYAHWGFAAEALMQVTKSGAKNGLPERY